MSGPVSILSRGDYLIASIQGDLSDAEVVEFRDDVAERLGSHDARGVVVEVAALDVIDSFVARALRSIAVTARLRGAETVIAGIKLDLAPLRTALDLDDALELLQRSLYARANE